MLGDIIIVQNQSQIQGNIIAKSEGSQHAEIMIRNASSSLFLVRQTAISRQKGPILKRPSAVMKEDTKPINVEKHIMRKNDMKLQAGSLSVCLSQ